MYDTYIDGLSSAEDAMDFAVYIVLNQVLLYSLHVRMEHNNRRTGLDCKCEEEKDIICR